MMLKNLILKCVITKYVICDISKKYKEQNKTKKKKYLRVPSVCDLCFHSTMIKEKQFGDNFANVYL